MEDNSRINRRSRPRPYDLRRKVLLKNFLREQMTHIPYASAVKLDMPETQIESSSDENSADFIEESSNLDEEFTELDKELCLPPTTSENSSNLWGNSESAPNIANSNDVSDNNIHNTVDSNVSSDSVEESSLFKLASIVKVKKESKKTLRGILKAKDVCKSMKTPMKTRSFKSGLERVFYGRKKASESTSSSNIPKSSPRSLFSLFKHRKEQRNLKDSASIKRNASVKPSNIASKYSTSNQSVQTDDSWAKEELIRVQESNKRLKEENRLLSESLSYFMTNASSDPHVKHCNSPLQSSNENLNSTVFPDYFVSSNSANNSASWNPRSRVTRSKSVQDYNERKNISRNNYRTRSMNYHNYRNNHLSNVPTSSAHNAQPPSVSIPRVRRKNAILPATSTFRSIQRRSSMPERPLSENDRSVICRRSGSFRDTTRVRKPFNSLPSEAFY